MTQTASTTPFPCTDIPSPPLGLALHTSTPKLGLAMGEQADGLKQSVAELGRAMSHELQIRLMDFLAPRAWSELDFLAVAQGPGGFTGTRLGMVTARTLAQQLDIPLYGISTLAAVAYQQWRNGKVAVDQAIALDMRAQRGQRFTALYGWNAGQPEALIADQVCSTEQWEETLAQQPHAIAQLKIEDDAALAVGDMWAIAQQRYQQGDRPNWQLAKPFYGQHPVTL